MYVSFKDPCTVVKCGYRSKCLSRADNTAECLCPLCNENNYALVCGDDGRTYADKCELEKEACKTQKRISIAKEEACGMVLYLSFNCTISKVSNSYTVFIPPPCIYKLLSYLMISEKPFNEEFFTIGKRLTEALCFYLQYPLIKIT